MDIHQFTILARLLILIARMLAKHGEDKRRLDELVKEYNNEVLRYPQI